MLQQNIKCKFRIKKFAKFGRFVDRKSCVEFIVFNIALFVTFSKDARIIICLISQCSAQFKAFIRALK